MGTKRVVVMGATGFIGTYLVENTTLQLFEK